jgi:hypothetical protein
MEFDENHFGLHEKQGGCNWPVNANIKLSEQLLMQTFNIIEIRPEDDETCGRTDMPSHHALS